MPRATGSASTWTAACCSPGSPRGTGPPAAIARIAPSPRGASSSARLAVVVHHGVGERRRAPRRARARARAPRGPGPSAVRSARPVWPARNREPGVSSMSRRRASSRSLRACIRRRASVSSSIRLDELAPLVVELIAPLPPAGRSGPSICSMSASISPCSASAAAIRSADGRELLPRRRSCSRSALASARSSASASAGDRRPPRRPGGASPPPGRRCVLGFADTPPRRRRAPPPRLELGDDLAQPALDAGELVVDRVHARGARRPATRAPAARRRLAIDRRAERLLRPLADRTRRRGTPARPRACARVASARASAAASTSASERVQARAGGPPLLEPLVPAALAAIAARAAAPADARRRASARARRPAASAARASWPISACCSSGFNWRRSSASTSCSRSRSCRGRRACARRAPCGGGAWRCPRPPR